jgi:hypothetical protein
MGKGRRGGRKDGEGREEVFNSKGGPIHSLKGSYLLFQAPTYVGRDCHCVAGTH